MSSSSEIIIPAGVSVAESVFGEPVWLVGSPIAPSQSVYAGGRPIHYFPGDQFLGIPGGILTPRSPDRYNEHFDRYINPRRFLTTADLDSLRELFPEAVGVHLLIAGFLIVLFEEEQHLAPADGTSGAPLCLGRPSDTAALAVVFQNFQQSYLLADVIGQKNTRRHTLVKAGFILPLEIRDSTILSGEVPNSTVPFNTLPARNRGSIEHEHKRRVFSSIE
ncbi:hypothetical protein N7489_010195 [Penicillium chrysogenum]|uniref:uncharacterized protein n=1 Tax=Penicillium chrysogenum TaxID=5076 RepID=UPI0024DF2CF2|nr:uncharacterized protein N7489_010195 [Penicillium chrysogenum]KAJ5229487.1 hypothetical protein N7489_010195 [Penicillium chrysogenum]